MVKAIYRASIVSLLLASCFYAMQVARAQIAPTNSAAITGSVSDGAGKPVANAKVSLSGPKSASTQTDTHGFFVFVGVPFGTYQVFVEASGLGTAARSLLVEGDTNIAISYNGSPVNGLKVIAQVSSNANAVFNVTPASVTQVNPIANAFEGETLWRTMLEQIPGIAQAGLANGRGLGAVPDGPCIPMQISINGALPYETAVLLDDMPLISGNPNQVATLTAGKGTNVADYPLIGFGSADVVRGPGANAPSIVDSIGGSFVLHPIGIVAQNHTDLSISTDPYGGIVSNVLIAQRWNKLSVVLTYGINDSPGPLSHSGVAGGVLFEPSTIDGEPFACTGSCTQIPLYSPTYTQGSQNGYGYQTGLLISGIPQLVDTAWSVHGGSIALNYALSPSLNMGIFYAGQISQMSSEALPWYTDTFVPPAGYTGTIPAGQNVSSLNLFLTQRPVWNASSLLEEKITAQLGHGVISLAALQDRVFSSYAFSYPTSTTLQLFGGGCIASSPGGTGGCSAGYAPIVFNGGNYNVTFPFAFGFSGAYGSNNRDILLSYALTLGENLHAGASFVKSYYDFPSQTSEQFSIFTFPSTTPSAISQTTNELRIFMGGNPSAKTSVDLSGYFTNAGYHVQNPNDSTGNTYVDTRYTYAAPRLGFVWRPTAAVAVRASAGGGFAEAPLSDLVGTNGAITPSVPAGSYSQALTNLNLQPEKSFGFDLGTDIRLRYNTVLSFDVYRTNLYGQLYCSTSLTGTYLGLPLYTTQYGNLGESRYEGLLVNLRHDAPHGIYWALSGGLTRGYVVSVPAGFYNDASGPCNFTTATTPDGNPCPNLNVVPGVNFNGSFTASIPYAQSLGRLGYRWDPYKYAEIVGTYYGNNNTYFRPAFVELDGHVGYPLSKKISLIATFRNITGIYDGPVQIWSPANLSGAPTLSGLPYALYGEEYGPRTVILTTNFRM